MPPTVNKTLSHREAMDINVDKNVNVPVGKERAILSVNQRHHSYKLCPLSN